MDLLKSAKAAIDSNPNLSPWEKFVQKKMLNMQLKDSIDREAENQCDSIDLGHECVRKLIRNTARNWQEEQQRLHDIHNDAELFKCRIHQLAENAKRQRYEQKRVCSHRLINPY